MYIIRRLCCHAVLSLSHVRLFCDLMDCRHQALLSMGSSRQKHWRGLPFPPPEDLSDPRIKPTSPASPALAGEFITTREFQKNIYFCFIDYAKAFDCVDHNKLWKIVKEMGIPD